MEERESVENKAEQFVGELSDMNSQARQLEEEIYKLHIEELQEVISQLEDDKASLGRKIVKREKEAETYKEQLASNQKQTAKLQFKLDKVWSRETFKNKLWATERTTSIQITLTLLSMFQKVRVFACHFTLTEELNLQTFVMIQCKTFCCINYLCIKSFILLNSFKIIRFYFSHTKNGYKLYAKIRRVGGLTAAFQHVPLV